MTLVFVALHPLAQSSGWSPALLVAVYATGWIVFYAAYWIARDPRRRRLSLDGARKIVRKRRSRRTEPAAWIA